MFTTRIRPALLTFSSPSSIATLSVNQCLKKTPSLYTRPLSHRAAFLHTPSKLICHSKQRPAPKLDPCTIQEHGIISYKNNKDIKPGYFETLNPNSLSQLTHLNLSGVEIGIDDLDHLIKAATKLEYLNINWNKSIDPNEIALNVKTKMDNLRYLKCMETRLSIYDIKHLLSLSPKLEKVSLHVLGNIKPNDFKRQQISHNAIHEISLFGTNVNLADIMQIIDHFPKLKILGLTRCPSIDSHDIIELKERFQNIQFI